MTPHDDDMLTIHVTEINGTEHVVPALSGWRVMEVIRDHDLPIRAECGGSCACATCHVYVAQHWVATLIPASADEADMLDSVAGYDPQRSRLSCQIILTQNLNGLEVTLAPGSEP